jgi:hypothetical protein
MGALGAWIVTLGWPLVSRVLLAAGIGTVTFVGLTAAVNSALGQAKSALGGLGGDVTNLLALAGVFESFSIMAGGIVAGLAFMTLKQFALKTSGA